jgi:hypothetical protein
MLLAPDLLPVNRAPVVGDFRLLGVRVDTRTVSDRLANYAACSRCNPAATFRFFPVRRSATETNACSDTRPESCH